MYKKTLIAATALVASFVAFQPVEQAEAKVHFNIGIGIPGPFYGHGGGYGHSYHAPAPYYGHGHRYRVSCGQIRRKLRNRGYYRIRSVDCSGSRYTFHAKRHGDWYKIRVKSRSIKNLNLFMQNLINVYIEIL